MSGLTRGCDCSHTVVYTSVHAVLEGARRQCSRVPAWSATDLANLEVVSQSKRFVVGVEIARRRGTNGRNVFIRMFNIEQKPAKSRGL